MAEVLDWEGEVELYGLVEAVLDSVLDVDGAAEVVLDVDGVAVEEALDCVEVWPVVD